MDDSQLPTESPAESATSPPSPGQMRGEEPDVQTSASLPPEEQCSEQPPDQTHTPESNPAHENQHEHSVQGKALRSLISNLTSEEDLTQVNRHQASTLSQLVQIKQGLATINKQSLDAYNESAADFIKAARLAGQVKQNLDDISRRLAALQKTLASRQPQQPSVQSPE